MKTFTILIFVCLILLSNSLKAQGDKSVKPSQKNYQISVKKIGENIFIDGNLDEGIWQTAPKARDFFQSFPFDSSYAISKTEVMLAFDDENLYVAAICFDEFPGKNIIRSLRRDFDGDAGDFFTIYLDTFGDQTNGFAFGVSPLGVQREGLITDGGNAELNLDWDNKWYAEAVIHQGYYTVEMAIPFKTLRFKGGTESWKVNFGRIDRKRNEISAWVPVPRNFRLTSLASTGDLIWEEPLKKTGANFSIIPYLSGVSSKNHFENKNTQNDFNVGADVKIGVTSSLNLDLTFNPDFSQVEVDEQVTNLDRFELFFPERRQFFLENNDLFAKFGFPNTRPFFSRRIGIARDTNTKLIVQNPILYGARLSGKVNKDWRVGFLNMQTARKPEAGIDGQNYTVAVFQRRTFTRSYFSGIFANRQRTSDENTNFTLQLKDYERIGGLEYNLQSKNNQWNGEAYYHRLFTANNRDKQGTHGSYLEYNTQTFQVSFNHQYVGQNYNAEQIGYVPRRNVINLGNFVRYKFFPKRKGVKVNNHGPMLSNNLSWQADVGKLADRFHELGYTVVFNSDAFAGLWVNNTYTKLFFDFDPTNTGGKELLAGTDYNNFNWYARYESNPRKLLAFSQGVGNGTYYNGYYWFAEGDMIFRIQPYGFLSLSYTYNHIRLPGSYNDADFLLIGPRFDITFTKSVFFTLFTQYNNQINNINLNARLQWRFKPVSDVFLVYTDNYFATSATLRDPNTQIPQNYNSFQVKNRALVLKITYWLNL